FRTTGLSGLRRSAANRLGRRRTGPGQFPAYSGPAASGLSDASFPAPAGWRTTRRSQDDRGRGATGDRPDDGRTQRTFIMGTFPVTGAAMRQHSPPRTYRVKSFGCQMNVYDGERMAELLAERGIRPADDGEDADLVVLNTCHIREKAAEKVYSDIGRLVKAGEESGRKPMIAVAGCVAQAEGEEIMSRAPAVSMVVGPQAYHRLPDMIDRAVTGTRSTDTEMPAIAKFDALPARRRISPSAFLTVQEGCDKFCTYCVVPYTRGAEISRPFADL